MTVRRRGYPYDPEKAKALLAAAGHPNGIDIELWTSVTPIYLRIAETIQAYLNKVGIRTKLVQRESAASRGAARKGQTDMILKDWYADYPDAEDFLYPLLHSANKGAGGNVSFFANQAIRLGRHRVAARARREQAEPSCIAKPTRSRSSEAPMVFLYFYNELYSVQPWIKHFVPPVIFNGQRWTDVTTRNEESAMTRVHPATPAAERADAVRRARRCVSAAVRRARRSRRIHGGRARRHARRSLAFAPNSTSMIRCQPASATT